MMEMSPELTASVLENALKHSKFNIPLRNAIENAVHHLNSNEHIHWTPVKALGGPGYPYNDLECSGCGYRVKMIPKGWVYCPHCGKPIEI